MTKPNTKTLGTPKLDKRDDMLRRRLWDNIAVTSPNTVLVLAKIIPFMLVGLGALAFGIVSFFHNIWIFNWVLGILLVILSVLFLALCTYAIISWMTIYAITDATGMRARTIRGRKTLTWDNVNKVTMHVNPKTGQRTLQLFVNETDPQPTFAIAEQPETLDFIEQFYPARAKFEELAGDKNG